ncbi:hypothetical protein [Hyphomicrobium sp.]|uniref:hypothetical protein n=1 Tax=Hyphomicrobium sp. TaxID=82 RepID=UPI0025BAD242|nr:hypothetical protein [Hyphomicrobium sp.]MCC7253078.1 hypothetical protein [Hyphomicrobium sp.]
MSLSSSTCTNPFELLELPDGRWCVARPALAAAARLIAGSFAPLAPNPTGEPTPVGVYASREEAELAIQRADPAPRDPLAQFADWLR